MTSYLTWLNLLVLIVVGGCAQPIAVREAASLPDDEVATIVGGGLPNVRSVDQVPLGSRVIVRRPNARVPAGSHVLMIDYQPCSSSISCGLTSVKAKVVLQPGQSYKIRHRAAGCSFWLAVAAVARSEAKPCRNFLWIEDRASGETIWGLAPVDAAG